MKKAVIFDMDGVIADTEYLHTQIEQTLLQSINITIDPRTHSKKYAGISDRDMFTSVFAHHHVTNIDIGSMIAKKEALLREAIRKEVRPVPHVIALLHRLKAHGYLLAVASGSKKESIITILTSLEVISLFDVLVSAEEVPAGKPAPDIFLLAAKRLGVAPEQAIVIEDGISGMLGAKSAGMECIGLVQNLHDTYPASILVTSLQDITLAGLTLL